MWFVAAAFQRGLMLLLQIISGFVSAVQTLQLVLPVSHQLPPPPSLRLPLQCSSSTTASAALSVTPELYSQLLGSDTAGSIAAARRLQQQQQQQEQSPSLVLHPGGGGDSSAAAGDSTEEGVYYNTPPVPIWLGLLRGSLLRAAGSPSDGRAAAAAAAATGGPLAEVQDDSSSTELSSEWVGGALLAATEKQIKKHWGRQRHISQFHIDTGDILLLLLKA